MRKLEKATWAALLATAGLAALIAVGAARLWRAAPVATALPAPAATGRRLVIAGGPERVLVIEDHAAYRIDGSLAVQPLAWPDKLIIDAVLSSAVRDGKLALTVKAHEQNQDPDKTWPAVLLVAADRVARVYTPTFDAKRAHLSNVLSAEPEEGEPRETRFAVYVQEDNNLYRLPFWQEVKRGDDDARHRIDPGFYAGSVERITWRAGEGPIFWCANERRTLDEHTAPVVPTTALDVFGNLHDDAELTPEPTETPLQRVLDGDQLAPVAGGPKLVGGREARLDGRVLASLPRHDQLWTVPLGARWLGLGREHAQAILVERSGERADRVTRARSVAAITDEPSPAWLGVLGALGLAALALIAALAHALKARDLAGVVEADRVEPGARGVFFGTLRVPEGALLETDARGHVQVASGCRVRVGALDLELGPGLERGDAAIDVPLIDGDQVFVIGRVEGDGSSGPWRGSGRLRLTTDGSRLAIGRGAAGDFAERVAAARNRRVLRLAMLTLALEIAMLARFGFAVFG